MKMAVITINLPDVYLKDIDILKSAGKVSSRSGGIRNAISEFLEREKRVNVGLYPDNFKIMQTLGC